MTRWPLVLFALSSACAVPIRASISPSELLREVERAEARRDGESPAIARALGASQPEVRRAALSALARSEQAGTASLAISLLGDRDPQIGTWAAFALGRIGEPAGEAALLSAVHTVSLVPEQATLALGRSGTATVAPALAQLLQDPRPKVRAAAALALGLMAKRLPSALAPERYGPPLTALLSAPERDSRFGAVYALFRLGGPMAAVGLIQALADADPEIRATAVRGLAAAHASGHVLDPVVGDPDWRVRVEVAKALGEMGTAHPDEEQASVARLLAIIPREFARFRRDQLASGRATHVLLQVIQAATKLGAGGRRVLEALEQAPWSTEGLQEATLPDQSRLACALAYALDLADGEVKRVRSCGAPVVAEWRRLELVSRLLAARGDANAVELLANLAQHQDPRVRVAAASGLGEIKTDLATAALLRLLDSNDPYLASAAVELLAQSDRNRPAILPARIATALSRIKAEDDPSLLVGLLDAAGSLGADGQRLLPALEALEQDPRPAVRRRAAEARSRISGVPTRVLPAEPDPGAPPPDARRVTLALETSRGPIRVLLFGDLAPHTVGALVELTQSGFYNGKTFHRIVPDFVAQGGCPRGDGWGGPGYTILSEGSPLPFVRGALGIATNGLDTGGSQFFIMHAYHPHLDGQYTLAGRVESGIEIVDALQEDDLILEAQILP